MPNSSAEAAARQVVSSAIKVHSKVGPGLLENAYVGCLAFELRARGLEVRTQVPLPIVYDGHEIDLAYRIDLLVENLVVVETKTVVKLLPLHEAQLLSYLRMSRRRIGFLLNFQVPRMRDGIKRLVDGWEL